MHRRTFIATIVAAAMPLPAGAATAWAPGTIIPRGWNWTGEPIAGLVRGCWGLEMVGPPEDCFWKLHHLGTGYHAASADDRETMEAFADIADQVDDFASYGQDQMPVADVQERMRVALSEAGFMRICGHYWTR